MDQNINYEVSVLSQCLVQPRNVHLVQEFQIFEYLDIHNDSDLVIIPGISKFSDPITINIKIKQINKIYIEAVEDLPPNAPPSRKKPTQVSSFINSDHTGNKFTRCYQSCIILYCNKSSIVWYNNRHTTVESSIFDSKYVEQQIVSEIIISLHYKLQMFIIPILDHADAFCDNEDVYRNKAFVESTLKKKNNSIFFHCVR